MSTSDMVTAMPIDASRRTGRRAVGLRKGERREVEILDATERLLATIPFAQLTMDDIAKEAGSSRSSLYFYFASKEQVLTALHQRTYREMTRTMDPIMDESAPLAEAMREALARVCDNWRTHRDALRTFHETAMVSPEFETEWRQRLEQHVTALTSIIEHERSAGRPRRARRPPTPSPRRGSGCSSTSATCCSAASTTSTTRWSSSTPWTSSGDG